MIANKMWLIIAGVTCLWPIGGLVDWPTSCKSTNQNPLIQDLSLSLSKPAASKTHCQLPTKTVNWFRCSVHVLGLCEMARDNSRQGFTYGPTETRNRVCKLSPQRFPIPPRFDVHRQRDFDRGYNCLQTMSSVTKWRMMMSLTLNNVTCCDTKTTLFWCLPGRWLPQITSRNYNKCSFYCIV